nr:IclR family transcriptional regulator C-terminal domain-containing protein [Boseongicola sp. H5]
MAVATPNRPFNIAIKVGTILPLHSTAQGKLWLSSLTRKERLARLGAYRLVALTDRTIQDLDVLERELDQIRSQGFAINKGENEVDLGAVSIPVKGKTGEIILTLSLFGLLSRFDDQFVARAIERLRRAAQEIQDQGGQ